MICPHMSRPVVYLDSEDPSVSNIEVFWVNCEKEKCPHYFWNYDDGEKKDRCSFGEALRND